MTIISTPTGDIDSTDLTAALPDRMFRDAWRLNGTVIELDHTAMKPIVKASITVLKEQKKLLPILSEGFTVDANSFSAGAMATTIFAFGDSKLRNISLLTAVGSGVTAATPKNHHLSVGQAMTIQFATPADYNGNFTVASIIDKRTFTYSVYPAMPTSPATGSPVVKTTDLPWMDSNGDQVFWDLGTFEDICRDAAKYTQDLTTRENILKALVDAATTVAEVDAIDITTGWPDTEL